jgi:glycosyltransferase involved in cell wall biosynthesis
LSFCSTVLDNVRPLRVLHLIQFLRGSGAERQVCDLLPFLQSEGLTVAALSMYKSGFTPDELRDLPFASIEVGRKNRADYSFLPRLVGQIRKFAPDIVHTHTHSGKYWGRVCAWMAGVRTVIFTEHNPCDPRRSRIEKLADPVLHSRTTRIVTFMDEQRRVLSRTDRVRMEKIVVIPNGLMGEGQESTPAMRAEGRRVMNVGNEEYAALMVGRLEFQKNYELALRAMAAIPPADRAKIRLFLAGSGTEEVKLRGLSRALDIEENVRFLGQRKDVPALLAGADVLLTTSLFEGMPIALIEAMNAGTPIVSTPWTGATDMLGNGRYGMLAPGWTPEDVAGELVRSLANPCIRSGLSSRAREYARQAFDIRKMARAHRDLYEELRPGAA